jgi:protein O-GlcNAc transferase
LALPGSFWCYDPMVAVPAPVPPPCTTGKPMVFGCVGNVAKITDRILACWSQILQRLPESRLLIRSVSFQDPDVIDTLHKRLASVGLDMARVDLRKPEGGAAFYASYNDIDIILDTYPFNGGTTTSFAVYMGVPVITWAGNSLVSRMGLSIMRNMGMPDAVVNDAFGYVEAAVRLATNRNALIEFRASARQRLCDSPLGNGQLFAREFEAACEGVLRNHIAATKTASQVEVLPARELTQRAYAVLVRDQPEAARRILGYALQHYPSSASACILETQLASDTIEGSKYVNVLLGKLNTFTVEEQISVRLFLAHHYIRCNEPDTARKVLEPLWGSVVTDVFDQAQLKLYAALLNPSSPTKVTTCEVSIHRILVLYVGDNFELHPDAMMSINSLVLPEGCAIEIKTTSTSNRIVAYREAMGRADVDMVLVLSLHVRITNPFAIVELANGLQHADILSFAGASQWERFDWRADAFGQKVATYMVNNADDGEALELRWIGCDNGQLQNNLAVLDGSFLAFKPSRMQGILLDGELAGAGVLMEEEWVHAAYHEGRRLGVMRTLGVLLSDRSSVDRSFHTEEYLYYISKWGKKVFTTADDLLYANVPVKNPAEGQEICLRICAGL